MNLKYNWEDARSFLALFLSLSLCLNKTKNLVGFNFVKVTKFILMSNNVDLYFAFKFINLKPTLAQTLILCLLLKESIS
jgi:hypothetical protein